jgi:transposase
MSRGRQAQAIKLSREDRKTLELLTRRGTAEQRQVVRAQIALMCHAGATTTAIAETVGVSVQTVSHWRTRLARQGLKGLDEVARPGRPRRIGASQRLELLWLACEPAEVQGRATPTLDELVERAVERGVVTQISRSHLQRILQGGRLATAPCAAVAAQPGSALAPEGQRNLRAVPSGTQGIGRAVGR